MFFRIRIRVRVRVRVRVRISFIFIVRVRFKVLDVSLTVVYECDEQRLRPFIVRFLFNSIDEC